MKLDSPMLEVIQCDELAEGRPAVGSALREPRSLEESAVLVGGTFLPVLAIAFHCVARGERFDVCHAGEHAANSLEPALDLPCIQILKHVGAHDEVGGARKVHALQI